MSKSTQKIDGESTLTFTMKAAKHGRRAGSKGKQGNKTKSSASAIGSGAGSGPGSGKKKAAKHGRRSGSKTKKQKLKPKLSFRLTGKRGKQDDLEALKRERDLVCNLQYSFLQPLVLCFCALLWTNLTIHTLQHFFGCRLRYFRNQPYTLTAMLFAHCIICMSMDE